MLLRIILLVVALTPVILLAPRLFTSWYARPLTYNIAEAPARPTAIVFGAGLWRDGSPTPVLRDRVATAVRLYQDGKAQQLLLSGGYTSAGYNEPEAMRQYALSLGVPDEAIVLDYAGQRTYDTCYRARHVFGVSQAILVTQGFHLPRAVYLCNALGLPAVGVASDLRQYRRRSIVYWNLREIPATLAALWDVHVARPLPAINAVNRDWPPEAQ
jgi:vancomycin permeability regulator SanA